MRLALVVINPVNSVNSFSEVLKRTIQQGNSDVLYFRIVDQDQVQAVDPGASSLGITQSDFAVPLRYLPSSLASMVLNSTNIDPYKSFQRAATMPFPNDDRSIWSMPIYALDRIEFNGMTATLTDYTNSSTYAAIIQGISYTSIAPFRASITISYVGGVLAGSELATISGNAITVQIQPGISTASQVIAAINASQAAGLVTAVLNGPGTALQNTTAAPVQLLGQQAVFTLQFLTDIVSPQAGGQLFC